MSTVIVRCPHCGFTKGVPTAILPAPGATTTCPRCRGKFPFLEESRPAKPDETSSVPPLIPDQPVSAPAAVPNPDGKSIECDLCKVKLDIDEAVPYAEMEGIFLCRSCYGKVTDMEDTEISAGAPGAVEKSASTRPSSGRLGASLSASVTVLKRGWKRDSNAYSILLLIISYFGVLYLIESNHLSQINWEKAVLIPFVAIITAIVFNSDSISLFLKKHGKTIAFVIMLALVSTLRNFREYIYLVIMYGPSFIGLMVAVLNSSKTNATATKFVLLLLALLLHGISAFMLRAAVGIGEAWSGYSSSHNLPVTFFFWGCSAIVFISFVRSKPMRAVADLFHPQSRKWMSMLLERWSRGRSVVRITRELLCIASVRASAASEPLSKIFRRFKLIILTYLIISCFLSGWLATRKVMSIGIRGGAVVVGAASLISDSEVLVRFDTSAKDAHGFSVHESDECSLWHPSAPTIKFNTRFDNITSKPIHFSDSQPAPHYYCADTAGNVSCDLTRDNSRIKTFLRRHFGSDSGKAFIVEYDRYDRLCDCVDLLVVNDASRAAKLYLKTKHYSGGTCYDCFTVPYPDRRHHKVLPTIFKFAVLPFAVGFDALTGWIQYIFMVLSLGVGGGMDS